MRRIVNKFTENGAISPETAKTPEEVGTFKGIGRFFARLQKRKILNACGDGRFYVDTIQADRFVREVRVRALIFLGTIIALAIAFTNATMTVPLWISIAGIALAVILIAAGIGLMRSNLAGPSDPE